MKLVSFHCQSCEERIGTVAPDGDIVHLNAAYALYLRNVEQEGAFYALAGAPLPVIMRGCSKMEIGTVVVLAVSSALGVAALLLKYRAKSFRALRANAETVRRLDPRPPVLFPRSFQDDYLSPRPQGSEFFHRFGFPLPQTFDEVLADEALRYGPAITAGLPGEELPPPGAARGLLPPDQWRDAVESLADTAALIIVLVGQTEGLLWEIKTLVLFVLPPATSDSVPNKDQGVRNIAPTRWSSIWSLADNSTWEKLFSMRQNKLEPILMHVHAPGWGYIVLSRSQTPEAYRTLVHAVVPGVLGGWSDSEIRPILGRAGFAVVGFGDTAEFDKGTPLTTANNPSHGLRS